MVTDVRFLGCWAFVLVNFIVIESAAIESEVKCLNFSNCSAEGLLPNWGASCNCDTDCVQYGDCCFDYDFETYNTTESRNESNSSRGFENWTCLTIKMDQSAVPVYGIATCPQGWPEKSVKIKEKCEWKSSNDDPFLTVPISSNSKRGVVYKNLYCAVCNGDANGAKPWTARRSTRFLTFEPPAGQNITWYRQCRSFDIERCPPEWPDDEMTRSCSAIRAPVRWSAQSSIKRLRIKNEFCAKCNNLTSNLTANELVCERAGERPKSAGGRIAYGSLSIVLDIDFSSGGTIVGSEGRCQKNYVFDPWKNFCRLVTCDKAVRNCVDFYDPTNSSVSCATITLDQHEFEILPNRSALVYGEVFEPSLYALNAEAGQLDLCVLDIFPEELNRSSLKSKFSVVDGVLTSVGLSISTASLVVKILLFTGGFEPKRTSTVLMFYLSLSLLVAQSLFLFGIHISNLDICRAVAVAMHYAFLASFFWTNALAFDIYCKFSSGIIRKSRRTRLIRYSAYGWTCPGLIVGASLAFDLLHSSSELAPSYGANGLCWFANRAAVLIFFACPLALILTANACFFAVTAYKIVSTAKATSNVRRTSAVGIRKRKWLLLLYIKLALLMGLTWVFGFAAPYSRLMSALFIVMNSLQGFFILIAFTQIKRAELIKLTLGPIRKIQSLRSSGSSSTKQSSAQTATSKL